MAMELNFTELNKKKISIAALEDNREVARLALHSNEDCDTYFTKISETVGLGTGFAHPYNTQLHAMKYLWFSCIDEKCDALDKEELERVIHRALEAIKKYSALENKHLRDAHDSLLIQLAILINSRYLKEVVDHVWFAEREGDSAFRAHAGMLSGVVLNDEKLERKQAELFKKAKQNRYILIPTRGTVSAFADRRIKPFCKSVNTMLDKHWLAAAQCRALLKIKSKEVILDSVRKGVNHLWPWPETTMILLLKRAGYDVPIHSPWIPERLLEGI